MKSSKNSLMFSLKIKYSHITLIVIAGFILAQCSVKRKVSGPETTAVTEKSPREMGLEGFTGLCEDCDTISSIYISKAEAVFKSNDERYEALVSIYALRDSLIYMSVVNSGFEIIRAAIDQDSIMVIDRLNKLVYTSPVYKRLGYQNPVDFSDIQNLVSRYYLCDEVDRAIEIDFNRLGFSFNEAQVQKRIILNRESLLMESFEFVHNQTGRYFMGERSQEGFKIYSNFMVDEFEVLARGGSIRYNSSVDVKMNVNRRKYTFVNF